MTNNILVVEDDNGIRKYLKEILIETGYSVRTAASGASALESINKDIPDLVLLDLKLPDISGETIMAEIKKDYPEVAVVILTAKDSITSIVEGLDLGADD